MDFISTQFFRAIRIWGANGEDIINDGRISLINRDRIEAVDVLENGKVYVQLYSGEGYEVLDQSLIDSAKKGVQKHGFIS